MIGELIAFIVAAGLYLGSARFLLRPVLKVAAFRADPVRFQMADLAALTLNISIALSVSTSIQRFLFVEDLSFTVLMAGSAISFASCLWWIAVRSLSQARIQDRWKRFAWTVLVVPAAYWGPLLLLFATGSALSLVMSADHVVDVLMSLVFSVIVIYVVSQVLIRTCNCLCNWVANDCDPRLGVIHKLQFDDW